MFRIALQQCLFRRISDYTVTLHRPQSIQLIINRKPKMYTNRVNAMAPSILFSTKSDSGSFDNSCSTEKSEKLSLPDLKDAEFILEKESPSADASDDANATGRSIDVDAEMLRYDYEEFDQTEVIKTEIKRKPKKNLRIPLTRGRSGVFEVGELCTLLKNDNMRDICVIVVPPEFNYVDFQIFATGRSTRHIRAVAEYIKWAYKQKRSSNDPQSVKVEGEFTLDWFALDLGNIAVHLMLQSTRSTYDLEQLWSVGPDYDDQIRLQSMTDIGAAASLEEFSFDSDLERFRKLREEQSKQASDSHLKTYSAQKQTKTKDCAKLNMESKAEWHRVN